MSDSVAVSLLSLFSTLFNSLCEVHLLSTFLYVNVLLTPGMYLEGAWGNAPKGKMFHGFVPPKIIINLEIYIRK